MQPKPDIDAESMDAPSEDRPAGLARRVDVHALREDEAAAITDVAEEICLDVRNLDLYYGANK